MENPRLCLQALIAKSKMLGNIKFIGELGKLNMLHERILHQCVKQLLEKKKDTPIDAKVADTEVRVIGSILDATRISLIMFFK